MATITELKWSSLTRAVNEIKSPNQFLKRLAFGNVQTQPTEDIEIGVFTKTRQIAPFVKKNGEALMVEGHGETFQTVQAPNIRIKRPFTPSELLFNRRPGNVIFSPGAGTQSESLRAHIARDLQVMANLVTNAQEFLVSQAIQGTISYQVSGQDNFTITFPKPAGNNITLTLFWDDADVQKPNIELDFLTAKRVISDEVGLTVTDVVLGLEASEAFLKVAKRQTLLMDKIDVRFGNVDFTTQFREDGAIFLGRFSGVNVWEYSRTAALNGVATNMIRPKFAEFLAVTPVAENVEYFGAIPDMKTLQGRRFQGERFSKSWEIEDPSSMHVLLASRPLPVPRRPGSMVSMKVVSG